LAALSLATVGTVCAAADSISGLSAVFRPQGGVDASGQGAGERSGASLPGLRVIVSSTSRTVASIDGQIVHVGDTVNGMRVVEINERGIALVGDEGVRERLDVHPSVVKKMRPVGEKQNLKGSGQ
jgi:hypothetical protein